MGYYVTLEHSNAVIPKSKLNEAYEILCGLNYYNELKSGGTGQKFDKEWAEANKFGANESVWFSWMEWNYPGTCATTGAILGELGFDYHEDEDGVGINGYDAKLGDEAIFLAALAPVLVSNDAEEPQFVWRGEDGAVWRQIVVKGKMIEQIGRIAFEPV